MTERDEPARGSERKLDPVRGAFTRALLEDLQVLERMLENGLIESGVRRIGAEQEVFLVDRTMQPALKALEVLDKLNHPRVTTELGLFNLEINLVPLLFGGDCLRRLEEQAYDLLDRVSRAARACDARVVLTGILPTIRKKDLTLDAMTPFARYRELNRSAVEHRGREFRMQIKGLDDLNVTHDNVMFEACNTSFQVHFQVGPEEFAKLYNLAQAITAPVLAASVNSPVFLQQRLWHETRLALFEQSFDSRADGHDTRAVPSRVVFGDRWVERSVLEIFREDIARFRVFLPSDTGESSSEILQRGELPPLQALCLHNGTVYRWNRPCYGIYEGAAHLRIEHRVLPSGPTVIDEIANAALFHGLMSGLGDEYGDITRVMSFDDAKANMVVAARYGLKARLTWVGGKEYPVSGLLLEHLLPLAREGLASRRIPAEDIDRYLGVVEERVRSGRTGAQWALDSLASIGESARAGERCQALVSSMYEHGLEGRPVHEWRLADPKRAADLRQHFRLVEQVMTTDLFTVRPDDLVDLAASLMDWEHIRHVPVEDATGHLVGLVTHRQLLRLVGRGLKSGDESPVVHEIMTRDPITVRPDTPTTEAIAKMRNHRVSCLPVVDENDKLIGIVSERDFIDVTARLLDEMLRDPG